MRGLEGVALGVVWRLGGEMKMGMQRVMRVGMVMRRELKVRMRARMRMRMRKSFGLDAVTKARMRMRMRMRKSVGVGAVTKSRANFVGCWRVCDLGLDRVIVEREKRLEVAAWSWVFLVYWLLGRRCRVRTSGGDRCGRVV